MSNIFINAANIISEEGSNWKVTSSIAYVFDGEGGEEFFTLDVITMIPKTYSTEQIVAAVAYNCKNYCQIQYDSWKKTVTPDWISSTEFNLATYLNKSVKTVD